ncbi:metalloregulator ArsR/SmtB family transcription factor [Kitasatospora sp. NPDC096128]|uniref:ArsR/SmtB family transcription factor n=1 Tax=Kitasatospora sp. NPDC096128 TaxID=3155547 RepID=UPI003320D6AC
MRRRKSTCRNPPTHGGGTAEVDVFSAPANPVRRKLLERLQDGPRAAGELAGGFDLSRPAVCEHLAVLRNARLVREEPRGRHRCYHRTGCHRTVPGGCSLTGRTSGRPVAGTARPR